MPPSIQPLRVLEHIEKDQHDADVAIVQILYEAIKKLVNHSC